MSRHNSKFPSNNNQNQNYDYNNPNMNYNNPNNMNYNNPNMYNNNPNIYNNNPNMYNNDYNQNQPPIQQSYNNNIQPNNMNIGQNQVIVQLDMAAFKSEPIMAACPTCKVSKLTNVTTSFSFSNYACYCLTTPIAWVLFQCFRSKDYNCNDAIHYCSACGSLISRYEAC